MPTGEEGNALVVQIKPFSYSPEDIDQALIVKASHDQALTNFIWSCTWYFHEKFWQLGYPQGTSTISVLKQWLQDNTTISTSTMRGLRLSIQEDYERVLCTFSLLADTQWQPQFLISQDDLTAMDVQGFIQAAYESLIQQDKAGKLPLKEKCKQAFEKLPALLSKEDMPSSLLPANDQDMPPHFDAITPNHVDSSKPDGSPGSSNTHSAPITQASKAHSPAITDLDQDPRWKMMQDTVDKLTHQNQLLQEQLKARPMITSSPQASYPAFKLKLISMRLILPC